MATKQEIQTAWAVDESLTAFKPDPEDMRGFMELDMKNIPFSSHIIEQAIEEIIENDVYFPRLLK